MIYIPPPYNDLGVTSMSFIDRGIDITSLPGMVMKYILPWFEVTGEAIRVGRQAIGGLSTEGTY